MDLDQGFRHEAEGSESKIIMERRNTNDYLLLSRK